MILNEGRRTLKNWKKKGALLAQVLLILAQNIERENIKLQKTTKKNNIKEAPQRGKDRDQLGLRAKTINLQAIFRNSQAITVKKIKSMKRL